MFLLIADNTLPPNSLILFFASCLGSLARVPVIIKVLLANLLFIFLLS